MIRCRVKVLKMHGYGGGPGVYFGLKLENVEIELFPDTDFITVKVNAGKSKVFDKIAEENSVYLVNRKYVEYMETGDVYFGLKLLQKGLREP